MKYLLSLILLQTLLVYNSSSLIHRFRIITPNQGLIIYNTLIFENTSNKVTVSCQKTKLIKILYFYKFDIVFKRKL